MDDELAVAGNGEDDHFEQLPVVSRSNHWELRRVGVGIHVHDHQGILDGLENLVGRKQHVEPVVSPLGPQAVEPGSG